jgi:1-deoxy-D-xylulose-5-phosphate synthase
MLEKINSPADLKNLSKDELKKLCDEIRIYIIETVSSTGGHLASSLGSVEITAAIHRIFDAPTDKILWDVGHQSYAHKILTGRRREFITLRKYNGISGFPNIFESDYDSYGVGHASTAISAALGFAVARDFNGEDHYVVSVVGDGAISSGLAFEGINQAGHMGKDRFIIVLNDNEMSISRNVGALAKYLTKITTQDIYLQIEKDVWELLGKVPSLGGKAQKLAGKIKESIKNLVIPNMLFEELGFKYFGPIDGHNLDQLLETFSKIRNINGPILVHAVTRKGKGYPFAEDNAEKFHGVGTFYKTTGNSRSRRKVTKYSHIFGSTVMELAERDERVVAVTAAMREGTGLKEFSKRFPDRFFDVGICEQHAVTFAAGLAREGYKPFVAIYSTFLQRSFDQLIHDVALQKLPVRFVIDRAGIVGRDGATHHGAFDISYMRMIPGIVLMAPADEEEMRRMLYNLYEINDSPSAIRFPRGAVRGVEMSDVRKGLEFGKGLILREGADVCILAVGTGVELAEKAGDILDGRGLEATIANARFIKPIDIQLVERCTDREMPIYTVEENVIAGGFGDAVSEALSRLGRNRCIRRMGIDDIFISHGRRDELLADARLRPEDIAGTVQKDLAGTTDFRRG